MQQLRRSFVPLLDRGKMKVSLKCAKCRGESPVATSAVLMVKGWRRLKYHLVNNPVTCPICPECRKKVKGD